MNPLSIQPFRILL
jgi:4-hydroxyphenylacetate 3-hydroxylase N terminal/4-hydroxyphenylacetate 3-hydroxylase C terminal